MIEGYQTKDIRKTTNKIFKKDGVWKFKWRGSECSYISKVAAEEGLARLSGTVEKEIKIFLD